MGSSLNQEAINANQAPLSKVVPHALRFILYISVRGDPGFCLDHLSPSMSTFPTMYSDDITLDIISLALSSSLSLCRLVLCKVSLFTRIYKQPSDSIPVEERNPRHDRRRQHTVTPSLSLSKRIDVVEHRNERTHISSLLRLTISMGNAKLETPLHVDEFDAGTCSHFPRLLS